jgi:NADH-quinone oxidoreductase subunit N
LFGITLIYGASGSFNIEAIQQLCNRACPSNSIRFSIPVYMLVIVGMCFKVGAAPFHFWTPDVYEGSPTLITTFMSTVVKTAGFAAFLRLFSATCFP